MNLDVESLFEDSSFPATSFTATDSSFVDSTRISFVNLGGSEEGIISSDDGVCSLIS